MDGVDAREGDETPAVSFVPGVVIDVGVSEIRDAVVDPGGVADGFEVAVKRPALEDGERGEIDLVAGLDDLLADPGGFESLGSDLEQGGELLCLGECFGEGPRGFGLDEFADGLGDVVERAIAEGEFHASV